MQVEEQAAAMQRSDLMLVSASDRLSALTHEHEDLQAAYESQSSFLAQHAHALAAIQVKRYPFEC